MKVLIVEDDFTNRKILQRYLQPHGECDVAVDGDEAFEAFKAAYLSQSPYDLICLDIMMPRMDGHAVLKRIRDFETEHNADAGGVKVIMTTALDDSRNVLGAFKEGAEAYVVKPIEKQKLLHEIRKLGLIND